MDFKMDKIKNETQKHLWMIDLAVERYKPFGVYIIERSAVFNILVLETGMGMVAQKIPIWN